MKTVKLSESSARIDISAPTYAIAGVILVVAGIFLFIFDERKKNRAEAKLCELLKRLSESQKVHA